MESCAPRFFRRVSPVLGDELVCHLERTGFIMPVVFPFQAQKAKTLLVIHALGRFVQNPYDGFGVCLSVGLVHVYSFAAIKAAVWSLAYPDQIGSP